MSDLKQVWLCGGGTQSCAIAALIVQGRLPKPDVSLVVDTFFETEVTWNYYEQVLRPALLSVGVDLMKLTGEKHGRFWGETFAKNADEPMIPVYSTQTGTPIKLPNICTQMWKIEVADRFLSREKKITKSKMRKWIGFSFDEQRRWARWLDKPEWEKGLLWFPLVDLHFRRRDCIEIVKGMGWPTPPRSACWMCPNHSDVEWRKLRSERPHEFQKAIRFEKQLQQKDPDSWLHRSCVPLAKVDFTQPEDLFTRACDSGLCFV